MELREVSHTDLVRLVSLGCEQFLTHLGTGEAHQVYGLQATFVGARREPLSLHIVDERACLKGAGGGDDCFVVWANDIFDLSLHQAARDGHASPQLCIHRKDSGSSEWVDALHGHVRALTSSHRIPGQGKSWQCEIYHHSVPRHEFQPTPIWLTLPPIMAYIYGDDYDRKNSNFVKATTDRWVKMLAGCGVEGPQGLVRASAKSKKAHLIYSKLPVPAHLELANEREFTVSVFALILVLVQNSIGRKFTSLRMVGPVRATSLLLGIVSDYSLGNADRSITTSEGFRVEVREHKVQMVAFLASQGMQGRGVKSQLLRGKGDMAMSDFLCELASLAMSSKTRSAQVKANALRVLVDVTETLAQAFDCRLLCGLLRQAALVAELAPPMLRNKRARRIPFLLKKFVSRLVRQSPFLRKRNQLLAGIGLSHKFSKASGSGDGEPIACPKPKSAQHFALDEMYQYWLGIREMSEVFSWGLLSQSN